MQHFRSEKQLRVRTATAPPSRTSSPVGWRSLPTGPPIQDTFTLLCWIKREKERISLHHSTWQVPYCSNAECFCLACYTITVWLLHCLVISCMLTVSESLSAFTPQCDVILLDRFLEHTVTHEHGYMYACTCHHRHTSECGRHTHTLTMQGCKRSGCELLVRMYIIMQLTHKQILREREREREMNKNACKLAQVSQHLKSRGNLSYDYHVERDSL